MTGRNPNVYYEVGYAHAFRKRVILVTKHARDIPFDLQHHRHVVYGGRLPKLKLQLIEELKWCKREPPHGIDVLASASSMRRIVRILAHVARTVAGRPELKVLLENALEEVTEILEADVCSIFLKDPEAPGLIRCVAGCGFARSIVGKAEYEEGEGFTGRVFQRSQTTILRSGDDLHELRQQGEFQGKYNEIQWASYGGRSQFRNGIAVPLCIGDERIGVIKVENKRSGEFTISDVTILEAIANGVLAIAIQNARLTESPSGQRPERRKRRKRQGSRGRDLPSGT
jgi:GAF domain-containing protein